MVVRVFLLVGRETLLMSPNIDKPMRIRTRRAKESNPFRFYALWELPLSNIVFGVQHTIWGLLLSSGYT